MFHKFIIRLLNFFSSVVNSFRSTIDNKMSDEDTGKILDPKKIRMIAIGSVISFSVAILVIAVTSSDEVTRDGLDRFKKESEPKFAVSSVATKKLDVAKDFDVKVEDDFLNSNEPLLPPTAEECDELVKKAQQGPLVNEFERARLEECLKDNIIPLSDKQKEALRLLSDPNSNLSPEARKLLQDFVDGKIDENDPRMKLIDALTSGDPNKIKAADKILGGNLTDEEKKLLEEFLDGKRSLEEIEGLLSDDPKELEKFRAKKMLEEGVKGKTKTDKLKNLKDRIAARQEQINEKENELSRIRKELADRGVFKKLQEGTPLTDEERELFDRYNNITKELKDLNNDQKEDVRLYSQLSDDLRRELINAGMDVPKTDSKISKILKQPRYKRNKSRKVEKYYDSKGREISPSEYKLLMAAKKRLAELKKKEEESGFDSNLTYNIDASALIKDAKQNAGNLVVWQKAPIKNYNLPFDLKVPVVLDSDIFVSSNDSANRRVILRLLDNIYSPETNEVLFAKGSRVVGLTQGFDVNTKLMQVSITRLIQGNKQVEIGFIVSDATGKMGIPGGVRDTRGKKITAAVLTEFAAGVVDFFANFGQQQQILNGTATFQGAATNAAFSGASAGLSRISESLVQDLQNAPSLFYAPKGMKLVISPQL